MWDYRIINHQNRRTECPHFRGGGKGLRKKVIWLRSSCWLGAKQRFEPMSLDAHPVQSSVPHIISSPYLLLSHSDELLVFLPAILQSLWPHHPSGNKSTFSANTRRKQGMLGASVSEHVLPFRAQLRSQGRECAHTTGRAALSHLQKNIAWYFPSWASSAGPKNVYSSILCNIL